MGRNALEQRRHIGVGQLDGDPLVEIGAGQRFADLRVFTEELHEAAVGIGPLKAGLDRLGQFGVLGADEEELGEGVADQQMLLDGEVGVLRHQLAALGEDLHHGARKEIDLVAVVDQAKQGAEATGVGGDAGTFQNLVVGPTDPLRRFHLPQISQGIDLVELLLGISVDEGEAQPFQPAKQRNGDGQQGGFERAGGTHPENIDGLALAQLLLEGELVEIELDGLDAKGGTGVGQGQFQQLVLVLLIEIVDGATGHLDRQNLCLCQQRQAQTQFDEPFHSLFSCRVRDVPGV